MHAIFVAYGERNSVEVFLRDLEAQKHMWKLRKGKKVKVIVIQGRVRILPLGVYEYIFPKEDKNRVLTTLGFDIKNVHGVGLKAEILRKLFGCKRARKFEKATSYLWQMKNVVVIPVGIRKDKEMTEVNGEFKGWTHEAL